MRRRREAHRGIDANQYNDVINALDYLERQVEIASAELRDPSIIARYRFGQRA